MKFKTKKQKDRYNRICPNDIPKYVRIYDNGGETFDRYTCVLTGNYTSRTNGSHIYVGMSTYPFHPQGFGQHGESAHECIDVNKSGWPPAMGKKNHLGTRIPFESLPEDCQKLVLKDYKYYWDFINDDGEIVN